MWAQAHSSGSEAPPTSCSNFLFTKGIQSESSWLKVKGHIYNKDYYEELITQSYSSGVQDLKY